MRNNTFRILAQNELRNNDTWLTGLNNNDLIIGPSGAGKTRGYVKPNLLQCNESIIVADTKGNLVRQVGPVMKKHGYKICNVDFTAIESSYGYNPLDYIRFDEKTQRYSEQDIMSIANTLCPIENNMDPFWDYAARMYLACLIGYVMECLPKEEQTLEYVAELMPKLQDGTFEFLINTLESVDSASFAVKKYHSFAGAQRAEKMHASICGIVAEKLDTLTYDALNRMYAQKERIDFKQLGKEKTAVFLTISDTDRSSDKLVNLFYTQALHALCESADKDYADSRLPIPVRIILDDFATNACIPDFDKTISVIRSREIYVSIILQSLTQLEDLYGHAKAMTIVNNCDNLLYLGGQDLETAEFIGVKIDKPTTMILNLPLDEAYLFTRGQKPQKVKKFDITTHERYCELPEAQAVQFSA